MTTAAFRWLLGLGKNIKYCHSSPAGAGSERQRDYVATYLKTLGHGPEGFEFAAQALKPDSESGVIGSGNRWRSSLRGDLQPDLRAFQSRLSAFPIHSGIVRIRQPLLSTVAGRLSLLDIGVRD